MKNHLGHSVAFSLLMLFVACGCYHVAHSTEPLSLSSFQITDADPPDYGVGTRSARTFLVTHSLPSRTEMPVIVLAAKREVWYIDGDNLAVIAHRRFADNESVVISQDGKFISVFTKFHHRRTGKTLYKMRVEDWTGRRLWEIEHLPVSALEPTPLGGFVAYTSNHAKELSYGLDPDLLPRSFPHPLMVYDSTGTLILEGVTPEECRLQSYRGVVSPEGRYLAFIFRWIPPEIREIRGEVHFDKRDRTCLVLYDLLEGVEKWRHYFDSGGGPHELVVGLEARRILCCLPGTNVNAIHAADYHTYCFDRSGNLLYELDIPDADRRAPLRNLELSPDDSFVAVSTIDKTIVVLQVEDGKEVWRGSRPEDITGLGHLTLDNQGKIVAVARTGQLTPAAPKLSLLTIDAGRGISQSWDTSFLKEGELTRPIVSRDGSVLWLKSGDVLRRIDLAPGKSHPGGE